MKPPEKENLSPEEVRRLALEVMAEAKFPFLATVDGDRPRVRPVSPVLTREFTVYVANLKGYAKTGQLEKNPNVELCYLSARHDQVRLRGQALVLEDGTLLNEIWETNPLLRKYLGNVDNPDLIVYQIQADEVFFMREWALEYLPVPLSKN